MHGEAIGCDVSCQNFSSSAPSFPLRRLRHIYVTFSSNPGVPIPKVRLKKGDADRFLFTIRLRLCNSLLVIVQYDASVWTAVGKGKRRTRRPLS